MSVDAGMGASVEAGGVGIGAGLAVQFGRLSASLDSVARQMRADAAQRAVRYIKPPPKQITLSGTGAGVAGFEGPKLGYQWTVRRITVCDAQSPANSTGAAVAYVYAGSAAGGGGAAAALVPSALEWIISPTPNTATWSSDQLVLQYGEHLYVQVLGGTAAQVLVVAAAYQLVPVPVGPPRVEV
jgi:hypothetical protein